MTELPARSDVPVAFMSYAHRDDRDGRLTRFRDRLERELGQQTGADVRIFKDSDDIELGEQWRKRLAEGLAASTFLLPIITPSFVMSPYCRQELETFLLHEQAVGREDLVLPVYYIDCEDFLTSRSDEPADATARAVLERQYFDWRELRHMSGRRVDRERTRLAKQIRTAMARVHVVPSPRSPAQPAPTATRQPATLPNSVPSPQPIETGSPLTGRQQQCRAHSLSRSAPRSPMTRCPRAASESTSADPRSDPGSSRLLESSSPASASWSLSACRRPMRG